MTGKRWRILAIVVVTAAGYWLSAWGAIDGDNPWWWAPAYFTAAQFAGVALGEFLWRR